MLTIPEYLYDSKIENKLCIMFLECTFFIEFFISKYPSFIEFTFKRIIPHKYLKISYVSIKVT